MTERTILVEDFPFINFLEVSVSQAANQHMKAKIVGMIDETFALECEPMVMYSQSISVWVYEEDEKRNMWLNGMIEDVQLHFCGGVHTLSLELVSHSKKSDVHKHTRTFQDEALTYDDVVTILQENSGKDNLELIISNDARKDPIDTFLLQYEETDWEFLKRLASRFHSHLFPCANLGRNGSYIGLYPHPEKHICNTTEYIMRKDMDEYHRNQVDTTLIYYEQSAACYIVESSDIYQLRDCIFLNGKELYVYAVESHLTDAQLVHTYTLKSKYGFRTKTTFNQELIGVTLTGRVHAVQKELVQIEVNDDIEQRAYRWFPYSTIYSSPDNTGWYFMPEIGDRVRLVFPNEHETDSYVVSSVHMGDRDDPDTKSIRTRYQKEIVFAPDFISISNGAGSHIELHDESGITIHSDKQILIESNDNIEIKSQKEIRVLGDAGVSIQQKDNQIDINDTIDITAGRLRMR